MRNGFKVLIQFSYGQLFFIFWFHSKPQPCFRNFQLALNLPLTISLPFLVAPFEPNCDILSMFGNIIIGYWIKTRNWNYVFKFSVVKLFYYFIISLSSSTVQTHVKRVESSRIKVEAKELLSLPVRNLYLINKSALNSIERVSVSSKSNCTSIYLLTIRLVLINMQTKLLATMHIAIFRSVSFSHCPWCF